MSTGFLFSGAGFLQAVELSSVVDAIQQCERVFTRIPGPFLLMFSI